MTNWNALAHSVEPPVPEDLLPEVIQPLEKLEAAFRPLAGAIPIDTLPWTGAGDET